MQRQAKPDYKEAAATCYDVITDPTFLELCLVLTVLEYDNIAISKRFDKDGDGVYKKSEIR